MKPTTEQIITALREGFALRIDLSDDGTLLDTASVMRLASVRREHVTMAHRDIYGTVTPRQFVPLLVSGEPMLADVVTGTLYDAQSGDCLSSKQMRLVVATGRAPVVPKPKRARKAIEARQAAGWMNQQREVA